jgi:putative peptide zinc metalloprotease protein
MTEESLKRAMSRAIRLRPDIQWSQFSAGADGTWVARDPICLEYFYFSDFEKSIVCMLDGQRTLDDILAGQPRGLISPAWLLRLVAKLENACLIVPTTCGRSGRLLWSAIERRKRKGIWQRALSPLAIRIKLFDPTRLLDNSALLAGLLFSRLFAITWLLLGLVVGYFVLNRMLHSPGSVVDSFRYMNAERAIGLVLVYACVKSLHELGHALACKRWAAECHDIGLMLLVFMPCLYCDTSDSWKLVDRWKRAGIAAAGIYVELILAVIAGGVWLLTPEASIIHLVAANVMIVCSISTVLVNANPLLRYDGYYVLSDIWSVPNLAEQSREAVRELTVASLTKRRRPKHHWDANAGGLAIYGALSWIYRHLLVCTIAWVVWGFLDGIGLRLVGALLVSLTLVSVILSDAVGCRQWIKELLMAGSIRVIRGTFVLSCLLAGGALFFLQPIPTFVTARAVTYYAHRTPFYAKQSGVLLEFALPGESVAVGSPIATLDSPSLELELIETRGEVQLLELRSAQLKIMSVDDVNTAAQLATVDEQLAKARERLSILEQDAASLVVVAERPGMLVGGPTFDSRTLTEQPDLDRLSPLLSAGHAGCFVERGKLLGWLGQPGQYTLTAYVIENDAELLGPDMVVRCRWDSDVAKLYQGRIIRISPEPVSQLPETLAGDASIATQAGKRGELQTAQPYYEVDIAVADAPALSEQSLATVYFETRPRTAYQSLCRLLDTHVRPGL